MKVLYNACYGGFNFSMNFVGEFNRRHPEKQIDTCCQERVDPDVIALFEEMGSDWSSGAYANLQLEEIPDDVEFRIREYDGMEGVSWTVPKDEIIKDLMDVIKGRKKEEETSKLTRILLKEDCSMRKLREIVSGSSS